MKARLLTATAALALAVSNWPAASHAQGPTFVTLEEIVVTTRKRSENIADVPLPITAFTETTLERRGISGLSSLASITPNLTFTQDARSTINIPVIRGLSSVNSRQFDNSAGLFIDGIYVSGRAGITLEMFDISRVEVVKGPQSALYGRNTFSGAINYVTKKPSDKFEGKISGTAGPNDTEKVSASLSGPLIEGKLSARIAGAYDNTDGTYDNHDALGRSLGGPGGKVVPGGLGGHKYQTGSGALRLTPSENLEILATAYYTKDRFNDQANAKFPDNCGVGGNGSTRPNGPQYFCGQVPLAGSNDMGADPRAYNLDRKAGRYNLTVSYTLPDAFTITSTTAYNTLKTTGQFDLDGSPGGEKGYIYATGPATAPGLNPTVLQGWPASVVTGFPTGLELPTFLNTSELDLKEYSQELRIQSPDGQRLRWLAGVSYFNSHDYNRSGAVVDGSGTAPGSAKVPAGATLVTIPFAFSAKPPPVFFGPSFFTTNVPNAFLLTTDGSLRNTLTLDKESNRSSAAFGQVGYSFTDALRGTAEVRWTHEKRSNLGIINCFSTTLQGNIGTPACNATTGPGDGYSTKTWSYWDPRFTLDYRVNESTLLYATAGKGTKSGGINQAISDQKARTYEPENNWTYDIGLKTSLMENRAHLNLSAFYVDWSNLQILSFLNGTLVTYTANVSGVKSKGFEAEFDFAPSKGWLFTANYGFNDAKYKNDATDASLASTCSNIRDASFACSNNIGGNRLQDSSRHTASASLQYTGHLVQDWQWFAYADWVFRSKFFGDQLNRVYVGNNSTFNGRFGVQDGRIDLTFWATNLFNKKMASRAGLGSSNLNTLTPVLTVTYAPRRQFGVTGTYRF